MFNKKKPLFSRPVLAAIMVFSTLLIWVLNLTAPANPYPTPTITTWNTSSGIPVIWLHQDKWKNTNKLALRFSFQSTTPDLSLSDATLSLLMGDSLPLSTSTINQRLAPLTASVSSYYDHESQSIGFTLNSEAQYLQPSLDLIEEWLPSPVFKSRSFDRWNRQNRASLSTQKELEQTLFHRKASPNATTSKQQAINLASIQSHYERLKQQATAIFIIGDMTDQTQKRIKATLNMLSNSLSLATDHTNLLINDTHSATIQRNSGQSLIETQSVIALTPLTSVKQWISLQMWGTDLVNTLNNQDAIGSVRLNLTLSAKHPWARWLVQHTNTTQTTSKNTKQISDIEAKSFIDVEQIPSINNKKRFAQLLDKLKKQLAQQVMNPSWWSSLAATTTQQDSTLLLTQFAENLQNAIDTFNQDDYKTALNTLLITPSYQEIQVNK